MCSNEGAQNPPAGLPEAMPDTGADYATALGEYNCGNLEHEFSARLIRFKDLNGKFGRESDGRRRFQAYLAELLADRILGDPELMVSELILPVPPKLNEDPSSYHLFDLVHELEKMLNGRGLERNPTVFFDALRFTGEIPPVKSIRLPDRPCALESRISCTLDLTGRRVLLLDDIIASGATAAECIRAVRDAGAERVALLALARRVG
jgi:predicted amidophosphoribosyltransferase